MISPKNLLVYCLFVLMACSSPKKDESEAKDSVATRENDQSLREGGTTFDIDSSLEDQTLNLFGKDDLVAHWLTQLYSQDHLINRKTDTLNANSGYVIKSVDLIEDNYAGMDGKCVSRSILLVLKNMVTGEENYDVLFLTSADANALEKVTYNGSVAQTTASVKLLSDYKVADNCPALAVLRESEGGDIDFGRMKEISFFISSESGMTSVFDLVLEDMLVRDYEVTGDENKNSTSEVREFEILDKKTNGLRDIKVHTTIKKDGEVTKEKDTIFHFNGEKYSE